MSYVIFLKIVKKNTEPCVSKQKQTHEWESSIETVRHKVQNRERERQRAKTDKEAFKYIKVQEKFENFQQVQNSY